MVVVEVAKAGLERVHGENPGQRGVDLADLLQVMRTGFARAGNAIAKFKMRRALDGLRCKAGNDRLPLGADILRSAVDGQVEEGSVAVQNHRRRESVRPTEDGIGILLAVAGTSALQAVGTDGGAGAVIGVQEGAANLIVGPDPMINVYRDAICSVGIRNQFATVAWAPNGHGSARQQLGHQRLRNRTDVRDLIVREGVTGGGIDDGSESGEVAAAHCRGGLPGGLGGRLLQPEALVGEEEEAAVFAVVEMRNRDRTG